MKRKRGAQPGNKNSYKHGFYSSQFKSNERRGLNRIPISDLTGEIEFMRVSLKRYFEALNASSQPLDLETQTSIMRALTLSTDSINSMIRTQIMLSRLGIESNDIMSQLNALAIESDGETGNHEK